MSPRRQESLGWDFPGGPVVKTVLPLQKAQVRSLVWKPRSHMPGSMTEKKKENHWTIMEADYIAEAMKRMGWGDDTEAFGLSGWANGGAVC